MLTLAPPTPSGSDREPRGTHSLWLTYQAGVDSHSEDDLVNQYLPLVKTIVGRLAMTLPPHVELEELQSAGGIGLLHAIRHFNPKNGTSFETYARFRIRGAVMDSLRRADWASRTVREKIRRIQDAMDTLEQGQPGPPSERQIASELGISEDEYRRWLDDIRPATFVSLDPAPANSDEDPRDLAEVLSDPGQDSPHDVVSRRELIDLITRRIQSLPEVQRKILALYYVEDLRLREIAEVFGLTESRISQLHAQAILAIRTFIDRMDRGVTPLPYRK